MRSEIHYEQEQHIPKKHFSKYLQKQSHLAELKIWIGFTEFVLSLIAAVILIAYVATKTPENLKHLLTFLSAVGSVTGITVGVRKYINQKKDNDD